MTANERKPTITWLEGLLDHYEAPFPHDPGDPRTMGFNVGRQIVGLYIIEMLLKYALDDAGTSHGKRHNLYQLFKNLHRQRRRAVERKYTQLLNNEFDSAWDVARTADSLLQYLGENPITDTRYFWEPGRHLVGHHGHSLLLGTGSRTFGWARFDPCCTPNAPASDLRSVCRAAQLPKSDHHKEVQHDIPITS